MAMVSNTNSFLKSQRHQVYCRKKEKDKSQNPQPYKVIEISPPPKNLGIRCLPSGQMSEGLSKTAPLPSKVGVRSASTLPSPDPHLWDYIEYVVGVVVIRSNVILLLLGRL
ncbi:uncharacterized protein LOC125849302 isoform X2 [Solanum stenotomum]|uniref:uncharacterized protein LOC125849302 isoform X2 n=1 Tax=Solanum stenotomum TaxID=172797 RepID=UPI0020D160FA|nr:uncharacterized protein LOC125849302 isoform X2 [Solanum stenotomum]